MKIQRETYLMLNRYDFDTNQCSASNGFAQIDTEQDCSYYGTWANPFKLEIVSFVEGDFCKKTCESVEEFTQEIKDIIIFTEENGYKFNGIDPGFNLVLKERFESIGMKDLLH